MNKKFLLSASLGLFFLGGEHATVFAGNKDSTQKLESVRGSKPNIIFILADDMGYNDVSFNGQKNFSTPALDRMAGEGMILTNHYSGSTVCGPSRATLLTGNHTGRVYQRGNGTIEFRPDPLDITIATRLKQAGYHTALIGKSGVAVNSDNAELPNKKGFDHFFGFLAHVGAHRYYPPVLHRNGEAVHYPQNEGQTGEVYSGDVILDDALRYLDQQGTSDNPFFLHLALQQPHADLAVPDEFLAPFIGKFAENPTAYQNYIRTPYPAATYAAMINYVDHTVRRVFQKLRELGIDENTLVMFSTDNGSHEVGGYHYSVHQSNAPFRGGKRDLYDGGIRVPTVVWWPGKIAAGTKSGHVSAFWDFAPTVLELAGLEIPESMDGISYLPTLLGHDEQQQAHEYLYWEFYERGGKQGVRYGQWKGIRLDVMKDRNGSIELYNIVDDPAEANNLATEHPDIVARIAAFMVEAHETPEFEGFSFD